MELSLEAYAMLMAELDAAGENRDVILAKHGLDEDQFDEIDTVWQDRLSAESMALDDGVSPLLATYAALYQQAQQNLGGQVSLETFARVTRFFQTTGDLEQALGKMGISFAAYIRSNAYWTKKMAEDPDAERRFHEALRYDVREES